MPQVVSSRPHSASATQNGFAWVSNEGRAGTAPIGRPAPQSTELASAETTLRCAVGAFPGPERQLLDAASAARRPAGTGWRWRCTCRGSVRRRPGRHHERIARRHPAGAARRREGQLFALRNGDLVLICRMAPDGWCCRGASGCRSMRRLRWCRTVAGGRAGSIVFSVWPSESSRPTCCRYAATV